MYSYVMKHNIIEMCYSGIGPKTDIIIQMYNYIKSVFDQSFELSSIPNLFYCNINLRIIIYCYTTLKGFIAIPLLKVLLLYHS